MNGKRDSRCIDVTTSDLVKGTSGASNVTTSDLVKGTSGASNVTTSDLVKGTGLHHLFFIHSMTPCSERMKCSSTLPFDIICTYD